MGALEPVRFALYADLGIAFGVPTAAILTKAPDAFARLRLAMAGACLVGLPLSVLGFLLTVAAMANTSLRDLDWRLVGELVAGTALGWAFLARMAALLIACSVSVGISHRPIWLVAPTMVAVATLAWSGHAAAGERALALPHLAGDIVHLLAASIWLGALALFLTMLLDPTASTARSGSVLAHFAGVGSILVVTLGLTGLANLWFIAPPAIWPRLVATSYGLLLVVKLALFVGMLSLAGLNRFVLVPRLGATRPSKAMRTLRFSIAVELCAALAILLAGSRLGLLNPSI
jgi:putative copper resistance protein D